MDEQIYVSKFYITSPGDQSVGIFPQTWEIGPDFYFDCQDDLDEFKGDLMNAFEIVAGDRVYIETAEEIAAQEEMDILMTEQMLEDMDNDMFDDGPKKMRDQYD